MKKILILLVVGLLFNACNNEVNNEQDPLIGSWVVVAYDFDLSDTINMDKIDKAYRLDKVKRYNEALEQNRGRMVMTWLHSVFKWDIEDVIHREGTWKLTNDSTIVSQFMVNMNYKDTLITATSIIRKLTNDTLKLYDPNPSFKQTTTYTRVD